LSGHQGLAPTKEIEMNDTTQTPSELVRALDRLVGTWKVEGGAVGTTRYEWMAGGHFLLQHVELGENTGLEVIGHENPIFGERSEHVRSRYYGNGGETFDYTYELEGDVLTIWGGEKGSPAFYRGTFSEDGNTLTGSWTYPGGGGYDSVSTRVTD
jgi:hypothetical protein